MQSRVRYLTLILPLSVLLTFYVTIPLIIPINTGINKQFRPKSEIKEIIAYSLKKQIEIESEEVACQRLSENDADAEKLVTENRGIWTQVPDTELRIFSIYYDDRLQPFHYLRLIGMIKGFWNETLYCQMKIKNNVYHITKAVRNNIWSKEWHKDEESFNPVLMSCYLPTNYIPQILSLSVKPCTLSSQIFKVNVPNKAKDVDNKTFTMTICVKPLNFVEDISENLLQWIEINKILGADRFEFYVRRVHQNVNKLLKFYSRTFRRNFSVNYYRNVEDFTSQSVNGNVHNLVESKDMHKHDNYLYQSHQRSNYNSVENTALSQMNTNYPVTWSVKNERHDYNLTSLKVNVTSTVNDYEVFNRKIWQKRRNEIITYNDCMYRNLQTSHFIIPVDIDEIIVPKRFYTWKDALHHLFQLNPELQEQFASFSVRNVYFLKEFSENKAQRSNVFFFDHYKRSQFSDEGESGKSFVLVKNTLTVFNHYALEPLKPGIGKTFFLPKGLVQKNHYRSTCSIKLLPQCVKYLSSQLRTVDELINKYKHEFFERYENVVNAFINFGNKITT